MTIDEILKELQGIPETDEVKRFRQYLEKSVLSIQAEIQSITHAVINKDDVKRYEHEINLKGIYADLVAELFFTISMLKDRGEDKLKDLVQFLILEMLRRLV